MQAIGYIRVSTDRQATEGVSLAAQRTRIRGWAEFVDSFRLSRRIRPMRHQPRALQIVSAHQTWL